MEHSWEIVKQLIVVCIAKSEYYINIDTLK